jgi:hypothetical protein
MANVSTGLWAVGFNLAPGQEHWWFQDGQTYGQVRWFIVHPLWLNGTERSVEISQVYSLVKANGVRQINVHVRNVGSTFATYAIWFAQTD